MERGWLEGCLAAGMSLDAIGERAGKHPSTVGYWLKKHGLRATKGELHSAKGPPDEARLRALVAAGLPLREIARRLERGTATIRYWLNKYEIEIGANRCKRSTEGPKRIRKPCKHHGIAEFVLEGRGHYRCVRCRTGAVARRRRAVKTTLVAEAGGKCLICGYARCQQALQFHHLDPSVKEFQLGQGGLTRSLARSRVEASKCVLLCANCHAEVEAGITEMPLNSLRRQSDVVHSD